MTGARYDGGNTASIGGSGETGSPGDAWLRPPHPCSHRAPSAASRSLRSASSLSSSSAEESDSAGNNIGSPKGVGEAGSRHQQHDHDDDHDGRGEGGVAAANRGGGDGGDGGGSSGGGVEEAPVVVGQRATLRKGSGLFGLKGGSSYTTSV